MDLTVARAVFTSALLKNDADKQSPDIKREDANIFPRTLLRTVNICTKSGIKACTSFIVRSILPSTTRTAALTKYLCTISKSCSPESAGSQDSSKAPDAYEGLEGIMHGKPQRLPHHAYKRLHSLYIVHDVLAFAIIRLQQSSHTTAFKVDDASLEILQAAVPTLAQLAVCADGTSSAACQGVFDIVQNLLAGWEKHSVLPTPITSEMHASLQEASSKSFAELLTSLADEEAQAALNAQQAKDESSKWLIPRSHGVLNDPTAPWHELPAANGLFQKRTRGFPLRANALPPGGYSIQNAGQKADEATRKEVEDLLSEAKRCFDLYTDASEVLDIDALGNMIWKPGTGRKRRNHWGWSYDGIEENQPLVDDAQDDYQPW